MKTKLSTTESLQKITLLDPTSTLEGGVYYRSITNKLMYELITKALECKNYAVTYNSMMTDGKGENMLWIVSYASMDPTADFPETGYMQPTLVVNCKNKKYKSIKIYHALRNPLNNAIIIDYNSGSIGYYRLWDKNTPEKFADKILSNETYNNYYLNAYALHNTLESSEKRISRAEMYQIFGEMYFDKKARLTSTQASALKKQFTEMFKSDDVPVYSVYSAINTMYEEAGNPRLYLDLVQTLTTQFSKLAVLDMLKEEKVADAVSF